MAELARACVREAVYSEDEIMQMAFKAIKNDCRTALKNIDLSTGLPFAGPAAITDSEEGPDWKQLSLFDYEDFAQMLADRMSGLEADYTVVVRLQRWGLERFGKAPEIPALQMPSVVM